MLTERIEWLRESISEDSRLTIIRLINEEIWTCFEAKIVRKTAFTSRGAAQMLFDIQQALVPSLKRAFVPSKSTIQSDSGLEHFDILKTSVSERASARMHTFLPRHIFDF